MRIHPASDIHADMKHNEWDNPDVDADVIVMAGDGNPPLIRTIKDCRRRWPNKEIVITAGNHDYYSDHRSPDTKTTWEFERDNAPKVAADYGVHLLDGGYSSGVVEIDGVRFVGGTAWTDFQSYPRGRFMYGEMMRMSRQMNDYRLIKKGRGRSRDVFEPKDSIEDHKRFITWLTKELSKPFDGETVLVTHHALSEKSLMAGVAIKDLDWCYASNCEFLFHRHDAEKNPNVLPDHVPPVLAIHGHTHLNHDYVVGETRVLCNPRGYPDGHPYTWRPGGPRENPAFDDQLVVEVGRDLTPTMRM
jgi:predicted phosphodiesterase